MGDDSRLRGKVKAQITRFASQWSAGWRKPLRRFAREMLYGIQAAEDVKVSEIARSLGEPIRLLKTETRLCRNLAGTDLTDRINRFLAWQGAGRVGPETVLALDLGDLTKPYAKAMEHLARVRDGSTGQLARGYWLCEVVAAEVCGDRIVPLYGELYSHMAEGFESENAHLWRAIGRVSEATGGRSKLTLIFKRVCKKAKRFYVVAAFFQYAVADGLRRLLSGTPLGSLPAPRPTDDVQFAFAFTKPPPRHVMGKLLRAIRLTRPRVESTVGGWRCHPPRADPSLQSLRRGG